MTVGEDVKAGRYGNFSLFICSEDEDTRSVIGDVAASRNVALFVSSSSADLKDAEPVGVLSPVVGNLPAASRNLPRGGIVKLRLPAVFDASDTPPRLRGGQHGGFATGWGPVSWGSIDELFVNLMPFDGGELRVGVPQFRPPDDSAGDRGPSGASGLPGTAPTAHPAGVARRALFSRRHRPTPSGPTRSHRDEPAECP